MSIQSWKKNKLFSRFTKEQLKQLKPQIREVQFGPQELIMQEGEPGNFLLLIGEGTVNIFKNELFLVQLGPGEVVGTMSLIDDEPRSATVKSGDAPLKGYILEKGAFQHILDSGKDSIPFKLLHNHLKYQQEAIRNTNKLGLQQAREKLEEAQKRILSGNFFAQMVLGLISFTFLLGFLTKMTQQIESTYVSIIVLGVFALWSVVYVRTSGLPLHLFGLTMKNFIPAIKDALKWTFLFLIGLIFLKWFLIQTFPDNFGVTIFNSRLLEDYTGLTLIALISLYALHSLLQEFIVRGCIQGGLQQFITGRWSGAKAIILATLMFSSFHLMVDMTFALVTIIPGMFWGMLFYRFPNLLAVGISHVIIGTFAFFALGLFA